MTDVRVTGYKYDVGKFRWYLVPFRVMQDVIRVLEFGDYDLARMMALATKQSIEDVSMGNTRCES